MTKYENRQLQLMGDQQKLSPARRVAAECVEDKEESR